MADVHMADVHMADVHMADVHMADNFAGADTDATNNGHDDLRDLVWEVFDEYITNEMPIRLLHIIKGDRPKIRVQLVDRNFVKSYIKFASLRSEIYNKCRNGSLVDREDSIRAEMKKGLRYVIFSHRWLQKEPLYQDMDVSKEPKEFPADPEPGWKKLQEFCHKALYDHDCEFAWSDTCCIDKRSSAELDESIRSMFRWYRNSHICVALLSETEDLQALQSGRKIDPWFLRGWTLQELLAPSQIKFYGKNWEPLISLHTCYNDRFSEKIMQEISRITHIPWKDLKSFNPGTNRVPEKMLWASKRRTTRIEDIAYCLIGIFDVSLMIAYGEGNRAFFRLMEEILKRYDKWDVFLWNGHCSHYNAALPNAPHCYPGYPKTTQDHVIKEEERNDVECDIGDRLFELTNHGLRISVLKLGIELRDTKYVDKSKCLKFRSSEDKFAELEVKHIGEKRRYDTKWAIGILDYWVTKDGRGFVDSRREPFTAFLLSYDSKSPDARWKKEMTEDIIKIQVLDYELDYLSRLFL